MDDFPKISPEEQERFVSRILREDRKKREAEEYAETTREGKARLAEDDAEEDADNAERKRVAAIIEAAREKEQIERDYYKLVEQVYRENDQARKDAAKGTSVQTYDESFEGSLARRAKRNRHTLDGEFTMVQNPLFKQRGGLDMSFHVLVERLDNKYDELFNKYNKIYNIIKSLGLQPHINTVDMDDLNDNISDLKILESKRDESINEIRYKILHYNIDALKTFLKLLTTLKNDIDTISIKIDKLILTHTVNSDSADIKYISITISRINDAVIYYIDLCESAIKSKNLDEFINKVTKINENANEPIKIDLSQLNRSTTIINNTWNIISIIDKIIRVQIQNFNETKESLEEENKLIHKKKELIINLEHLQSNVDRQSKVLKLIQDYKLESYIDNIEADHEIKIMESLNEQHVRLTTDKTKSIDKTIGIPDIENYTDVETQPISVDDNCKFNIGDKVSKKGESKIGTVKSNGNCTSILVKYDNDIDIEIPIDELDFVDALLHTLNTADIEKRMNESIKLYSKAVKVCNILLEKEIHKIIAITSARTHNISMLSDVKCQRSMFEMNLFSTKYAESLIRSTNKEPKTINGSVLDIIHEDGKTKLVVKTKLEGIITKELKYCKSTKSIEKEKEEVILAEKELLEAAKIAGFNVHTPVICKKILSSVDKHWHHMKNVEVYGDIHKIIKEGESSIPGFVLTNLKSSNGISLDPEEYPHKFSMSDCTLAYTTTLEKLDQKKSKRYILKQLEKLKGVATQIDDLDVNSADYDFKLKSLNKIYHYIKDDINNKLSDKKPTLEEVKKEEEDIEEFKNEVEINKLKKEVGDLTKKREFLEKVFSKKQKDQKADSLKLIKGGLNNIQHAGSLISAPFNNYLELKESINKVNLDSILLESKSLLNRINF